MLPYGTTLVPSAADNGLLQHATASALPPTSTSPGHYEDHLSWRHPAAARWLSWLHYAAPLVLLFFFLIVFTTRSIRSANNPNDNSAAEDHLTGPGGKPLPRSARQRASLRQSRAKDDVSRPQKLLFEWISVLAACTFLANATIVILHSLVNRKEGYWCGQAYVVSCIRVIPGAIDLQAVLIRPGRSM